MSIQTVEFEKLMFHFLAALPVMAVVMSTFFSAFGRLTWPQAFAKSVIIETVFNLSCLLSIGIYRLLFHRCGRFPGPMGAKLSRFWTSYTSIKNFQYHKELEKMQAKYGDFVRTGPREITVTRASAVNAIYGPASKLLKSTCFDVIGEVAFGKDFGNLATGTEHSALKPIHEHIKVFAVLGHLPWLMNIMTSIPSASSIYTEIFSFCEDEIRAKQKLWDSEKCPSDIVSWLLKAVHDKDASAAPTTEALEYDSRLVLLAGSDTASSTLANALFFLCKNVGAQEKLREQLRQVMPGGSRQWDYEKVQLVTFLDDIIAETLRLRPAVLVAGSRETPPAGLQIDEVHIPGNTNVLVPVYNIQRDPRYWPQAGEFIPERWGDRRSEMGTDKAPYFPFLAGAYSCPGKNLAYMSLRIALSTLVQKFDISFAAGESGTAFENDDLDTFVVTLPPLHITFTPL
ncbi:hypothetical protein INS49_000303 [Diaporthe citri]|uniref:uncharacterized protein n=1 Tax=Diaporthe citri TaxID=83186 RepID=UPI001C7FE724|nr:uncharacterized protein INS49_000303 [Diaporthe citri]KAG6366127.1 hypothetical protein INS49_000303 [Diaporthe citri]